MRQRGVGNHGLGTDWRSILARQVQERTNLGESLADSRDSIDGSVWF
jgi:hypothetical protein